jgi:hypothetical protein
MMIAAIFRKVHGIKIDARAKENHYANGDCSALWA